MAAVAARCCGAAFSSHSVRRVQRSCRPVTVQRSITLAAPARRDVRAAWFKFGKNGMGSEDAGIYGSQGREDYTVDDVEHYFNYMGMLAVEGTYDRMEAMLGSGLHPVDVLLLMAASENDTPKVEELLKAGADVSVKDNKGKSPMDLATKPEVTAMLREKVNA